MAPLLGSHIICAIECAYVFSFRMNVQLVQGWCYLITISVHLLTAQPTGVRGMQVLMQSICHTTLLLEIDIGFYVLEPCSVVIGLFQSGENAQYVKN